MDCTFDIVYDQYFNAFVNKDYNFKIRRPDFILDKGRESLTIIPGNNLTEYVIQYDEDRWVIEIENWIVQYVTFDHPDVAKRILRRLIDSEITWDDLLDRNHYRRFRGLFSNGYNYLKANNPTWRHRAGVSKYIMLEDIYIDNNLGSPCRAPKKRLLKKLLKQKGLI